MEHDPCLALIVRGTMAVLVLAVAAFLLALVFELYTPESGQLRGPKWMVGAGSVVLAAGGLALLWPDNPKVGWATGMLILACMASSGLWIGLFADPTKIGGGLLLVSHEANLRIGQIVFTLGGLLCAVLLAWGLWLGPHRQRGD